MNVVVLLSGGMDSVSVLYKALEDYEVITALSFDYGAKHNAREIPCAKWHCNNTGVRHEIIELPFIDRLFASNLLLSGDTIPDGHYEESSMKQTVVPFRNAIMLSIATGVAESREAQGVVIGAHAGDHAIYPDCRERFMVSMADSMEAGTYAGIQLIRPFITFSKADIVTCGDALNVPFKHTWSCYKGIERHCGTCGTCVERREAFLLAGVKDPTDYMAEPAIPKAPARGKTRP